MRWFGNRKSRTAKAASLKAASSLWSRLVEVLTDTDILLRLFICAVGVASLLVASEAWKVPFPFRLGDYARHGVLAHIRFERIDIGKTERARQKMEETVSPVFLNDIAPLQQLPGRLRLDLMDVVTAPTFVSLSAETRASFGWTALATIPNDDQLPQESQADWLKLKEAVGSRTEATTRIDALCKSFTELIEPLSEVGIMDPALVVSRELRPEDLLQIEDERFGREPAFATVSDTLLTEQLKPAGRIGRSWGSYPLLVGLQPLLERWLLQRISYTLTFDEERTNERIAETRKSVEPVREVFKKGAPIVPAGQNLNEDQMAVLTALHATAEVATGWMDRVVRVLASLALLLVLVAINAYHLIRQESKLLDRISRLAIFWGAIVVTVGLGRALSFDPWRAEVIPVLCTSMVVAIAYDQVLAAMTGFSLALLVTLATGRGLDQFVTHMAAIAVAVALLSQVSSRSKIIKVGFVVAVVHFLVSWGLEILHAQNLMPLLENRWLLNLSLIEAFWCLVAGYLVAGSLPFVESVFGVVTDISLLEMGDISHPLLQELIRRAPGTYNHSITVATISENAADAIGANGLLCRVGAYFHDIGKMLKPKYFVENVLPGAASKHEHLAPAMSTLIIIGHVKDGVDLARQHNLPQPLVDFIEQHHGTTLVEYFYHAATRHAESQPDHRLDVEESAFRYPGPKPQTREAAVMMLADVVEGASRALSDPTPKRIETLVHEMAMKRLLDGQFDECGLTLSELAIVEDSLTKSLTGIYHGRIKYPERQSA